MERIARILVFMGSALACLMSATIAILADSPRDKPPHYCTVFNHFVKSGGSSVKKQLYRSSFKAKNRRPGLIDGSSKVTPTTRLDTLHNASVIVGHGEMIRDPLHTIGRDCDFFTMMRHPIDRIVSAFYYCPTDHDIQGRPSKWCGNAQGESEPLEDRFMEFASLHWGNRVYASMLHSLLCDPRFDLCDPGHAREKSLRPNNIDTAEGWLLHDGIKLSMRLFNTKVRSPVRDWDAGLVVNPGGASTAREELLGWAYTNVDLHNILAADMLLYD